jgi:transcriptional regulator with GAF, ATPase, and Fis domain
VTAYLTVDASIVTPAVYLNTTNADQPFAAVTLSADQNTRAIFHTPGEARELAAVLERAAVLLEEHAASQDVTP